VVLPAFIIRPTGFGIAPDFTPASIPLESPLDTLFIIPPCLVAVSISCIVLKFPVNIPFIEFLNSSTFFISVLTPSENPFSSIASLISSTWSSIKSGTNAFIPRSTPKFNAFLNISPIKLFWLLDISFLVISLVNCVFKFFSEIKSKFICPPYHLRLFQSFCIFELN